MGAQIALMLQNHNYNLTYVNRGFSFESALLDSLLMLAENKAKNVLFGGIDEITEESWLISTKTGVYKKEPLNNLRLLEDKQEGALAGEGASFFMLSNEKTDTSCSRITAPETFYKPENSSVIKDKIMGFLNTRELNPENIDLILYGYSGDKKAGHIYEQMEHDLFRQNPGAYFKHLSGEYDTAVAFAVWLGTKILKTGTVPEIIRRKNNSGSAVRNILIYNISHNMYHSLILLEEV